MTYLILDITNNNIIMCVQSTPYDFSESQAFLFNGHEIFFNEEHMEIVETETTLPDPIELHLHRFEKSTGVFSVSEIHKNGKLELIRYERDRLLSACDWTQISDVELSDEKKLEWSTYRKALRDLPSILIDGVGEAVWPSKPE